MIDVHGESHYVPALERLAHQSGVNLKRIDEFDLDTIWLRLIPEPANPHDPKAIMVASPDGRCLGHIGRTEAAKYAEVITELAETHELWCRAQIGGGLHNGQWRIGVWLYIPTPGELEKQAGHQAAESVAMLGAKWRDAQVLQTEASQMFDAILAQMRVDGDNPDGEHMLFARANLEKAVRGHLRAAKALHRAVNDFQGKP